LILLFTIDITPLHYYFINYYYYHYAWYFAYFIDTDRPLPLLSLCHLIHYIAIITPIFWLLLWAVRHASSFHIIHYYWHIDYWCRFQLSYCHIIEDISLLFRWFHIAIIYWLIFSPFSLTLMIVSFHWGAIADWYTHWYFHYYWYIIIISIILLFHYIFYYLPLLIIDFRLLLITLILSWLRHYFRCSCRFRYFRQFSFDWYNYWYCHFRLLLLLHTITPLLAFIIIDY
jgi:hypothetical protein